MILGEEAFIDLYEVLEVKPEADVSVLRQRISVLYLEARANLDHRSHRKRFYYRELYEIHLPKARLLLLDPQKRAAYNEQLHAQNGPQKAALPKETAASFAEFGDVGRAIPTPIPPNLRMERKDVEMRRDHKRRELIKYEIIANGFKWGFASGFAVLLACVSVILILHALVPGGIVAATGVSLSVFLSLCGVLITAMAFFTARQTMRWARQRTVGYLSKLPYDELLRQCAG